MKNKFFAGIAIVIFAVVMSGCSKVPQAEIDAANTAIANAKAAGADVYASENFIALKDSMNNVMINIESQKSKFFKSFSDEKELLAGISSYAAEVEKEAEMKKEELKVNIQKTLSEISTLIASNHSLVLEAPKGKEGTSALQAIKSEISALESAVNEVVTLNDNGEYMSAMDKASAIKEKATALQEELSGVIAKYKANTKTKK